MVELDENQATYDQYNKVPNIETAAVVYEDDQTVACGCFKPFGEGTLEIKRMFVRKDKRRKGYERKFCWTESLGERTELS